MTLPSDETAAQVVARARKALRTGRLFEHPEGVVFGGEGTRYGVAAPFELHIDAAGRFRLAQEGPLPESVSWDGNQAWATDWSGSPRRLELYDLESAQLDAEILSGHWLLPRGPFAISLAAGPPEAGAFRLRLAHRSGRLAAEMRISRATGLPASLRRPSLVGDETWSFARWREAWGIMVPTRVSVRAAGTVSRVYNVRAVSPSIRPAGRWYPAPRPPADVLFDRKASSRLEVVRGKTGHVITRVSSRGRALGWFLLDTGAGGATLLDPRAARRIGGEALGTTAVDGVFGTVRAPVRRSAPITIGPLTLTAPFVVEMDLGFLSGLFTKPVSGIIGWDLFARAVAELDLSKDLVALYDPERFRLPAGSWRKLSIHTRHPVVPGTYEGGRAGLFKIDTGAAGGAFGNVTFHTPTVLGEGLLADRELLAGNVGATPVFFGKLASLSLMGRRFANVNSVFSRGRKGAFSDPYTDGNVGVNVLRFYRLFLDFGRRRIAWSKADPPKGPAAKG